MPNATSNTNLLSPAGFARLAADAETDAILAAFRRPAARADDTGRALAIITAPTHRCPCGFTSPASADYCPACHRSFND
jgi:hypothetical protein